MTQWSNQSQGAKPDFSQFFKDDYGIILLRGKNSFGTLIYSYVKVSFPNIDRLQHCLRNSLPFSPSDFGEVIAAGTGEPTDEVRLEVGRLYPIIDQKTPAASTTPATVGVQAPAVTPPLEKKGWDEY
ncbi:MAG: hypothetical protein EBR02_08905 [Alphaproteobacteria bacterium]|nr:hypothetical protein [Alphaproteobacteria bacterium]